MPKKRKVQRPAKASAPAQTKVTRRGFMQNATLYGVSGVAVAGLGFWGVRSFQGKLHEQDMSIIGSGTPAIVQIHDPTCPVCTALQREARAALDALDSDALAYRVANVKSDAGLAFATTHGSSHATLLFFDGAGTLTQRIQGATNRDTLQAAFAAHIGGQ